MRGRTVWLSCAVVRAEMEELRRRGLIEGDLLFLDSMLHMDPPRLEATLAALLEQKTAEGGCPVLVYGDCSAHLLDLTRSFGVERVDAINCAQLLVGRARYRRLMLEEAFLVLPEWALRWERIMRRELGLTRDVARELMGEHRGVLVYLDTGLVPVPEGELAEFSSYTGLPFRVEEVALDTMLGLLLAAGARAESRSTAGEST